MKQSSTNENVVIGNNETIETCMNDEIMEENVGVQTKTSKNPKNENKSSKLACTKKKLETTWKIIFVLEFLLCQL
jgi:hypothetical protein